MTDDLQRVGAIAAILMAGTFLLAFAIFLGVLLPAGFLDDDATPSEKVEILAENRTIVSIGYLVPYVGWGLLQVVLSIALYERLKDGAGARTLAQVATIVGLMWATLVVASGMVANVGIAAVVELQATDPSRAAALWTTVETIQLGLGGGNEIVGGAWILLVSWAAHRAGALPRALDALGVVAGVAAVLTVVPGLESVALVFGVGLIVWYLWYGAHVLRERGGGARDEDGRPMDA